MMALKTRSECKDRNLNATQTGQKDDRTRISRAGLADRGSHDIVRDLDNCCLAPLYSDPGSKSNHSNTEYLSDWDRSRVITVW